MSEPQAVAVLSTVDGLLQDEEFRARLLDLLSRRGVCRVPRDHLRYYHERIARRMLDSGATRPQVLARLQAAFEVSRRTAYRRLRRAAADL